MSNVRIYPGRVERKRLYYRIWSRRKRAENQKRTDAIKLEKGCVDCGYREHPAALDFDHNGSEKLFDISKTMTRSWKSLKREIDKCVVRCANCHRIYSYKNRYGGYEPDLTLPPKIYLRGSQITQAKLNEKEVREIKRLLQKGMMHVKLAERFGVTNSMIGRIASGKAWKHV